VNEGIGRRLEGCGYYGSLDVTWDMISWRYILAQGAYIRVYICKGFLVLESHCSKLHIVLIKSILHDEMHLIAPFRAMLLSDANETNYLLKLPSSHSCS
jgi:hypothetical protein